MPLTIAGHVFDRNRRPINKVNISFKGKKVGESKPDGSFSVGLARAEARVALTFAADGYVPNTRIYNGKAPGNGTTVIVWVIAHRIKFDPQANLDIELNQTRIQIPARSLTGPNGRDFEEIAELQFTLFDRTIVVDYAVGFIATSGGGLSVRQL
jgi:hypothetical protein